MDDYAEMSLEQLDALAEKLEGDRLTLRDKAKAVASARRHKIAEREVLAKLKPLDRLKPAERAVAERIRLKAGVAEAKGSAVRAGGTAPQG
jgi:hypothetical protein